MSHPQQRRLQARTVPLALLSLFMILLFAAGCALLQPPPPPDALATYRPALQPDFKVGQALVDTFSTYSITVRIDPTARIYTGTAEITVPLTGTLPTSELYFRLYPNLSYFAGSMDVNLVRVNNIPLNYGYAAEGTAIRIVTPKPWEAGSDVHVRLGYTGKIPLRPDDAYTLFGESGGVLSMTNFYPILAARRAGGWVLDIADPQGDIGFHDIGLYQVTVTVPEGQVVAATGTAVESAPADAGWVTTHYLQGPAREFMLIMSPNFAMEEAEAYGTRVRSYYLKGHEDAGRSALYDATASLQIYSDVFGPFPYQEMAVVEAPITFHGMEFPGLVLIGTDTYDRFKKDLETRVSHEVAHQWWYAQVGNDQVETPWLDEGLTEFSMYYYYAYRYGQPIGAALRRSRWETPVRSAGQLGTEQPIGLPVKAYKNNYEAMVYAKGALFFAVLRDELGPDTFLTLLHTYLDRYRWRIATQEEFQALAEEVSGKDLDSLFVQWLRGQ